MTPKRIARQKFTWLEEERKFIKENLHILLSRVVDISRIMLTSKTRVKSCCSFELQTLKLIAEGCSNQEIAQQLFLSLGTVKSYVRMILNKLSVDDRVQAAALAVREGLI